MGLSSLKRIALGTFTGTDEQNGQAIDIPVSVELVDVSETGRDPAAILELRIEYPAAFDRTVDVPLPRHTVERLHNATGDILDEGP